MKTLLVTAGREIVKQISNGCQGLPLLMKKELIIEKPTKNGLQIVTRKKRFTFK